MVEQQEVARLLGDPEQQQQNGDYGTEEASPDNEQGDDEDFVTLQERGWSFQENRRAIATASIRPSKGKESTDNDSSNEEQKGLQFYVYCIIYALVNVIISAPGLFGYAAVIFNNDVFDQNMNALSKLVIFSSLIHQLGFTLFSSLPFAIGTVQDAGLIFLSGMANTIANTMKDDGHTQEEILSTTLVLLSAGTASLGLVLIIMGRLRLADAVSYLPMPVVGGYLAYIGFFCIQAGVALSISKSIVTLSDWKYLLDPENFMHAAPALVAGLLLTLISRKVNSSFVLPLVMVGIPALFYLIVWICGATLSDVREEGWVGDVSPSVPVRDLFGLVDFAQVRWDMIFSILPTWVGMVFVVSFASCLDVAAISIDMGEALDTNGELTTVGICNVASGLMLGYTGSYIFSQTIFTYRTRVHSRLIGVLIMVVFGYIVISPINILEISPLFFLGSTLIFIGYDLCYEWLFEVREQIFLTEYFIVWLTFCSIQVVGIDAGIVLGVLIAIVEQIVTTAQISSVIKVDRRSRAVWTPSDAKLLHDYAYSSIGGARIVTVEIHGTAFFGNSLSLLNDVMNEIGLNSAGDSGNEPPSTDTVSKSMRSSNILTSERLAIRNSIALPTKPPKYLVLDLTQVTHLDASATRGCFLQLVKLCEKNDIVVCASGATPRIEWMFRSHGVSMEDLEEENEAKAEFYGPQRGDEAHTSQHVLLFVTVQEALEFCETMLLHRLTKANKSISLSSLDNSEEQTLADVVAHMLGSDEKEKEILAKMTRYHEEIVLKSGEYLFRRNTYPDSFYVVLSGVVANSTSCESIKARAGKPVMSGAGLVTTKQLKSASNTDKPVATFWQVGGVFGYNDYLLDRPRRFGAVSSLDGTKVARINHSHENLAKTEDPALHAILQKILLHASTLDLANCTCHDV